MLHSWDHSDIGDIWVFWEQFRRRAFFRVFGGAVLRTANAAPEIHGLV
jgi:hypothetical protein